VGRLAALFLLLVLLLVLALAGVVALAVPRTEQGSAEPWWGMA
jgi:hypothetical protein